jgi:hypothetical protein
MPARHRQRAEQTMPARVLAATGVPMDRLVYALYGLTEAEIALVAGAVG